MKNDRNTKYLRRCLDGARRILFHERVAEIGKIPGLANGIENSLPGQFATRQGETFDHFLSSVMAH